MANAVINFRITDAQRAILDQWIERHPTNEYGMQNGVSDALRAAIVALDQRERERERKRQDDRRTTRPRQRKQPDITSPGVERSEEYDLLYQGPAGQTER